MQSRTGKAVLAAIVAALLALGAYWYWSPFLALKQMQAAARAQDAATFNAHVDYPRLRESLKAQLAARVTDKLAASTGAGSAFGAMGALLGGAMVDKLVDVMVRPETVMRGMQSGQFGPQAPSDATPATPAGTPDAVATASASPKWTYVRNGADQLVAYRTDGTTPVDQGVRIVFERSGFATWKLTDVRMPSAQP